MSDAVNYDMVFDIEKDAELPFYTGKDGYKKNRAFCEKMREGNSDILLREFTLADLRRCTLVLVDGMCDKEAVELSVVLASRRYAERSGINKFADTEDMLQQFASTELSREPSLSKGYISALTGDVFVIIEGESCGYVLGYRSINSRSVGESPNEGSVTGPHEAFTENLRTNTGLLRRRISDPNFVIEALKVGKRSHSSVALCYIRGLTDPELIKGAKEKLSAINIDIVNDAGELAQLIEDRPNTLFPSSDATELPDNTAAELCAGRVAVMLAGSPQVLLLPATISSLMSVGEDRYQRWSFSSFVKLLRWLAMLISVTGPSLYVAMVAYHPGLLPTKLLILTAVNRLNVPFSAVVEVIVIELFLELLREASIRMPKSISTALSIVGGLIIGDAAISAGLISPLLIIVIGLTTMAGFTVPSYPLASSLRLVKYMLLALTALLGLLGLCIGLVLWLSVMTSQRSFGVDFTAPFAPLGKRGLAALIELPIRLRKTRPAYLDPLDSVRYSAGGD